MNPLLRHAHERPDELTLNLFVDKLDTATSRPLISYPHSPDSSVPCGTSVSSINVAAPSLVTSLDTKKPMYHPVTVGRINKDVIERAVEDRLGLGWWERTFSSLISNSLQARKNEKKSEKKILFLVCGPEESVVIPSIYCWPLMLT
jgi:hypothetical protein